jgi:phospholipid/cholesterol/gamma-HCH transport system substrate-binding protein
MKDSLETRLGVFVAIALIAGVLVLEMGGGMDRFRRGVRIHALFDSAQELKPGDRVKMAGVDIGRVANIGLTNGRVRVTMKLRADNQANTACVASIKFAGLMGQSFVLLDFGKPGADRVTDGTFLETMEQPDFGVVLSKLSAVATNIENLTKGFAGDEFQNLASSVTGFFKDNRDNLRVSFQNISNITTKVSSGEGTVGKLIMEDTLYSRAMTTISNLDQTLSQTSDEIRGTMADARKIVDDINAGKGTAGRLVKDESLFIETTNSMTNLREILQKINRGEGSVGKLINDDSLIKNTKLTLQKLDKATEGLEDQGPLSVIGIMANSLF